jgi:hypothetical protein
MSIDLEAEKPRLIRMCRALLVDLFSDGQTWQPAELEDALVGFDPSLLWMGDSRWLRTPFKDALADLVGSGDVIATKDPSTGWHYKKAETP